MEMTSSYLYKKTDYAKKSICTPQTKGRNSSILKRKVISKFVSMTLDASRRSSIPWKNIGNFF